MRLESIPTVIHPGAKWRLVIVNDSSQAIVWGGCFGWQRWVNGQWQGSLGGQCLADFIFRPHSRTGREGPLSNANPPGRYRITFVYQDAPGSVRQPELVASTYLTVVAAPVAKGTLTGGILFVGGDPLDTPTERLRLSGGVVTVSGGDHEVVAHTRVRADHRFRFQLPAGPYQLAVDPSGGCPPEAVQVRADITTRINVDTGCDLY